LAWSRIGGTAKIPLEKQTLLFQQGLLHLLQDFCFRDTSNCQSCPFPSMIQQYKIKENYAHSIFNIDEYRHHLQTQIASLEKYF
ncbi:MAG: hypothetical protein V4507_14030, partial [Verrucomicrobiota bacterium]